MLLGDAPGASPNVSFQATANVNNYWGGLALDMWNAPVYLTGSVSATGQTIALPPHQAGDLIVFACARNDSNTVPAKPAAGGTVPTWVDIDANTGANNAALRTAYAVATANNHTSGTWNTTAATILSAAVIRGQGASPIGGHAEAGGAASTSIAAPAITLVNSDASSLILCVHIAATAVTFSAAPAGYTRRVTEPSTYACINTKNDSTTDGSVTQSVSASTVWRAAQIEIRQH
jgi:hypothetical protein